MVPSAADTTNALLSEILALQFGRSAPTLPPVTGTGQQIYWVNGLWFAALSCSLSTALISMLAKQWLQAYLPNISGTARHRARQRQSKYMHLEAWHVPAVIDALPFLLHVALLLFFAGLILLLWSASLGITLATWIIVSFAYIFYFTSIWLPLMYPDCPYQHPISDYIRSWLTLKASTPPSTTSTTFTRIKRDLETGMDGLSEKRFKDFFFEW